jgi:hypothetical protein
MIFFKKKGGQSQIVAAVVLVLIVISLLVIVLGFILPFVRDNIEGTSCFNADVTISNSNKFNCLEDNAGDDFARVQVHVGVKDNVDLEGFVIEVGGASSKSVRVTEDYVGGDLTMYGGGSIELPGDNEERTYKINLGSSFGALEYYRVYPIIDNGRTCEATDTFDIVIACTS